MHKDPDNALLIVGLLRAAIWIVGIYVGVTIRRVLPTAGTFLIVGFSMGVVTAIINALSQSGAYVNDDITSIVVYTGWILASCLVTGVALVSLFLNKLKERIPGLGKK